MENEFKIIALRKNKGLNFCDKFGERFLNTTSNAREINEKICTLGFIKNKHFCASKGTINK
jgi:hypothetical protein